MSDNAPSSVPPPTAEVRRICAQNFDRANQVIATGNYDYGINMLLTCCKLDPSNMLYRQTLRRTQKAKFNNNLRGSRFAILTTSRHKARLKVARQRRDFLRVLEHGEQVLSRNPWDTGTQMDMAEAANALGCLDMAIYILDQARQKNPEDVTVNRALARLFEKNGNFTHAIKLWTLVREAAPDDVEASHKAKDLAASETIQRGQYGENTGGAFAGTAKMSRNNDSTKSPIEPVDRATRETAPLLTRLENEPSDTSAYLQLSSLYRRQNQPERARAVLQQGLAPTGHDFRIQMEMMELDLEPFRRNLSTAEDKIRKLSMAGSQPDFDEDLSIEELRKMRTRLLKEINSREIELYRLKADRYPSDLGHRLELGIRLSRAELLDEAIVELQQARRDQRLQWRAAIHLGFCFKKRNNWRLAQRNFEEALPLIPASEETSKKEVLFQLAIGHADSGELVRAIDLGHELANLDFSFREISRLIDEWQERLQQA